MGVILAGGRASRFAGTPKGLEQVHGRRIVDAVAAALAPASDSLLLVANAADREQWLPGVRVARDVFPDLGSLGGLHAALAHADGRDVLVVAWDMPFVTATLLRALRERGAQGDVDAVVPRSNPAQTHDAHDGEPLCAWYAARCLPVVEALIRGGERRAGALARAVGTAWLDATPFGDPARLFANVNTPDDLRRARESGRETNG